MMKQEGSNSMVFPKSQRKSEEEVKVKILVQKIQQFPKISMRVNINSLSITDELLTYYGTITVLGEDSKHFPSAV